MKCPTCSESVLVMAGFVAIEANPGALNFAAAAALGAAPAGGGGGPQSLVVPALFGLSQVGLCGWAALNIWATEHIQAQLLPHPEVPDDTVPGHRLLPPRYVAEAGPGLDDGRPASRHQLLELHEKLFAVPPLWGAEAGPEAAAPSDAGTGLYL